MLPVLLLPAAMSKPTAWVVLVVCSSILVLILKWLFSAAGPVLSWFVAIGIVAVFYLMLWLIGWEGLVLLLFCILWGWGMINTAPTFRF